MRFLFYAQAKKIKNRIFNKFIEIKYIRGGRSIVKYAITYQNIKMGYVAKGHVKRERERAKEG